MRGIFPLRAKRAHSLNSSSHRRRGILRNSNAADQAAFSVLIKPDLKNQLIHKNKGEHKGD
ncbi:MAG: hypothetical protein IIT54_06975 [Acetobacter sp.]|nr:hypothetical protein [Acetobacter sp.]